MSKENNSDDEGNHNDIENCDGTIENKIDNLHPSEYDQEVIDEEEYENVDNDKVEDDAKLVAMVITLQLKLN